MRQPWFRPFGWFYVPASLAGGMVSLGALIFCVNVFIAVDRHSHSVSDTFYGAFPFFTSTFLLVDWVARNTKGS